MKKEFSKTQERDTHIFQPNPLTKGYVPPCILGVPRVASDILRVT